MKTKSILLILWAILIMIPFSGIAQDQVSHQRDTEAFSAIIVGGYYKVTIHSGPPKIIIHAKESVAENIRTEVRNGVLQISSKPMRQKNPIQIDIYSEYIVDYDISGAVIIESEGVQKPENLHLDISGAAMVKLNVETEKIDIQLSGAAALDIRGIAKSIDVKATGASIINTSKLTVEKSKIIVSGAAGAKTSKSGKSSKTFIVTDAEEIEKTEGNTIYATDAEDEETTYGATYDGSTARAKFLGINVYVDEDDESGEVRVGTHKWVYSNDGEVTHKRVRLDKFNGHWGGVGLGINGYVNDKFVYDLPEEYEYMDLLWQKSVNVDLNIYEQNIRLSPNGNIGLVTGIGYSIYNYRFTKSFTVMQDSNHFSGLYNQGVNVRKSKFVTNYITIPVLFEIQDNNPSPLTKYRWHVNVGAIFGLRVHTHQKTYFNETNKDYVLVNPLTNEVDAYATSPSYAKSKVHDDFYMSPFKLDASLRIGWGWINLYGNVSLIEMFNVGKGPKLYPFSVGIMLVGW
ncbi:MAG: outer membrane beta-barrel protein [Bacteroidales bacterium]|nr:outer membrane beta-barrel protein [Bacteroidales bacterium]